MQDDDINKATNQIVDWLTRLKNGNKSEQLCVIGETLVGLYANTYSIDVNILEIKNIVVNGKTEEQ